MAEVFRARRADAPSAAQDYAIKQLSEELSRDPLLVSMFVDEARLASQLKHPSIVQLTEFGTDDDGRVFMVMEFVDGRDLRWCLAMAARAQYWLPVEFSLSITRDLCRALGYAHQATAADGKPLQIVHRDVSHSNVFLSKRGDTKLADFGIARAQGRQSKTRTGLVKGKLGYLSPEQVRAERLDGRSDLFSAAVVLWELLTQRRMFVGETEFKTMVAVCTEPRIPPSNFRPGLPKSIDDLCLKGVAIARDERFEDAAALEQEIDQVAADLGLQLGNTIVSQVLGYLEDCAQQFAPEEAARLALSDDRVSPEEALAHIEKGDDSHTQTPTPSNEGDANTGSYPVITGELPSDSFASSWADNDQTVTEEPNSDISGPGGEGMVDLLASRTPARLDSPAPPRPLPSHDAREHTAELRVPDAPTYFHSQGQVQSMTSFGEVVLAMDPRTRRRDDAVSADGRHWMPAERFGMLIGMQHSTMLQDVAEPIAASTYTGASLVGVLSDLALNGFTGRLIVDRPDARYGVMLEVGGIVELLSNRPSHQVLAVLTAAQLIPDSRAMTRAMHEVISSDRDLDDVLEASFGIPREHVEAFRHAAARDVLRELLSLGDARYAYEKTDGWPGRAFIAGTALEPVLKTTCDAWTPRQLDALVDAYGPRKMSVRPGFPLVARMLRLKQDAAPVLREIQPKRTVRELIDRFPAGDETQWLAKRLMVIFIETGAISIE